MQQVITIQPDGGMSGLHHKKGKGLDLRQFGKVSIRRVSEILWDEDEQNWYVRIIDGPLEHTILDQRFDDYDEAVEAEISFLNEKRREGVF